MLFRRYQFLRHHIFYLIFFYVLDVTTNGVVKKMKQNQFSNYLTACIAKALLPDAKYDINKIKFDLKLSILKPIHAKMKFSNL